ncbi:DUF2490 domain-containing protein [Erythrobacter oryzae]|uniref:DUF2490 domain-containing protein n=1 Tax=Erythrobacter oryzae TaxID=3019556 RepID=UPI00255422A3|nr:DUF2490 domain-containing protein [Erythrobacter sp. COR-2]
MKRAPTRIAMLLAALACAWQPSSASAADEDTQFWLVGFVRSDLGDDFFLTVDASLRIREPQIGPDQQTIRVTVEKEVADGIRIGGGAAVFETDGQTEFRPHQQLRIVSGGWDFRTRFEQRMFPGADRTELRFRQRVQYTERLSKTVDLIGSAEWFTVFQARSAARQDGTEQVRFVAAVAVDVAKGLEVQPGYVLWYSRREGRTDGISHIPQLTLNYRF